MTLRALASFLASFPVDSQYEHPEGCYLARKLEQHLRIPFPAVEEFDNWRDCGWSVPCTVESSRLWVCFARYSEREEWQLFIEPLGMPGFVGRLLGMRSPSYIGAIQRVAVEVHRILKSEPMVSAVSWAINADPRSGGVPEPSALPWPTNAGA